MKEYWGKKSVVHNGEVLGVVAYFPEDETWRCSSNAESPRFPSKEEAIEHLKKCAGVR